MNIIRHIKQISSLTCGALAIAAVPALATSNGMCGPNGCVLVADGTDHPSSSIELFYQVDAVTGQASWYEGLTVVSSLGGLDWQPVVGDFNGDDVDDLAVYKDGIFSISWSEEGGYNVGPVTTYSMPTSVGWGASTIPMVGDWDGSGDDDLGIYTNGKFKLFTDSSDFGNAITIDFGYMPQNSGYIFTQMPFSGPLDNNRTGTARVGIYYGNYAQYAPTTVTGNYDFFDLQNTDAVVATVTRPDTYARPTVLNAPVLEGSQFVFMLPPGLGAVDSSICEPESDYSCHPLFPQRPQTQQPVIEPPPGTFPQ